MKKYCYYIIIFYIFRLRFIILLLNNYNMENYIIYYNNKINKFSFFRGFNVIFVSIYFTIIGIVFNSMHKMYFTL